MGPEGLQLVKYIEAIGCPTGLLHKRHPPRGAFSIPQSARLPTTSPSPKHSAPTSPPPKVQPGNYSLFLLLNQALSYHLSPTKVLHESCDRAGAEQQFTSGSWVHRRWVPSCTAVRDRPDSLALLRGVQPQLYTARDTENYKVLTV